MRHLSEHDGWYVLSDGCLAVAWRNRNTGEVLRQRKRRRAGVAEKDCTWHPSLGCADHPRRAS